MFAAETIQGTGKLACPRCGTVFQFRPATPAPTPRQQIPVAQPVRPVTPTAPTIPTATPVVAARVPPPLPTNPVTSTPTAVPALPALPAADDDEEEEDDRRYRREVRPDPRLAFEEPAGEDEENAALVRRRRGRQPSWGKWLWLGPLLLTFTSTTAFLIWWYVNTLRRDPGYAQEAFVQSVENAVFPRPEKPWNKTRDDVARADKARFAMRLNFAAYRSDPSNAIGLYHYDYRNRLPGENELIDITLQKLRLYFTSIQWEQKEEGGVLGEKKGIRIEFQAVDADEVPCSGEVFAIAHRGIGYWFFSWCPETLHAEAAPEWDTLRGTFELGTKRQGWKETPPKSETAQVRETSYQVRYPDEMWEIRNEVGWDAASRLTLVAYEREGTREPLKNPRHRYSGKMAVCQVLRLPKEASIEAAVEATKKYLLEQQKAENENAALQAVEPGKPIKGRIPDGPAMIGGVMGYLMRQEMLPEPGGKKRFFLLAIVNDAEGMLVLEFECNAERREYWESEFAPVWQSLRVVKQP
jgi:hypothetical protein